MQRNIVLLALAGTALLTGCVDDSYDLKDVDYTLQTTSDLWIPQSSTGDIILKNVLDLDDDSPVQIRTVDGVDYYYLIKEGQANVSPVEIGDVTISKPEMNPFTAVLKVRELVGQTMKSRARRVKIKYQGMEIEIPDASYAYDITEVAKTSIKNAAAKQISSDLTSLSEIDCQDVTLTLNLSNQGFPQWITRLHLDNLALNLPEGLHVKSCTFRGQSVDVSTAREGRIEITQTDTEGFAPNSTQQLTLTVDGADVGEDKLIQFDAQNHIAQASGDFRAEGLFRLTTEDMDMDKLTDAEKLQVVTDQSIRNIVPETVTFDGEPIFSDAIRLTAFSGSAQHQVNNIDPIKLNNLPDFLQNEDVILDLDNPQVYLSVQNGFPAAATAQMTMTGVKDNVKQVEKQTSMLTFEGQKTTQYCLANQKPDSYPSVFQQALFSQVANLGQLIQKIPDQIQVSVSNLQLADCQNVPIGKGVKYAVDVNYMVWSPLQFGQNFKIVYEDTEDGWAKDLDDIEDLDAQEICLEGQVDSDLPLNLTLTITPIDKNGQTISQLQTIQTTVKANAKNQAISVSIKPTSGHTLNDAITGSNGVKQLDGIILRAVADQATTKETLKAQAALKIHNAKLGIKGGITYDAN